MKNRYGVGAVQDAAGIRSIVIMNPPERSDFSGLVRLTPDEARNLGRELVRYAGPSGALEECPFCAGTGAIEP